ncbi:sensor domain-containing diguanylate cyclase [Pantoea sp. 1.19]|uniref:sensor domain-containing diguanylate cyclase n=1 Tax=Pantoea sp. 1.19 TaxID=1925589 RepID=UPI000948BB59|nr:sensor domain-containing diguanylate cyclase [Pantoea sp. 1.19]
MRLSLFKRDLRTLITLLAIASIVITLATSLYASWRVQRQALIDTTLEANRVYATKLASTTELYFQQAQSQLAWSASHLADRLSDSALLTSEVTRLREQTHSFNSVLIVDARGWVKGVSPESLKLLGRQLRTEIAQQALTERKPLISQPAISAANNLVVFISWPIWSKEGEYQGYVGGTLYLRQKSILQQLLGAQYYRDGSSLMVSDSENRVLYHQQMKLVGQKRPPPIGNAAREQQQNGAQQVSSPPQLVGYAVVPTPGWTIYAIKPTEKTLAPLSGLLLNVLKHSLPVVLLTLIGAWLLARLIALPLWQLARNASQMDNTSVSTEIGRIRSWYFESAQIKRALLTGITLFQDKIGRLRVEVQTDPLTGLLNRRGLTAVLEYFLATRQSFAVLALDIDHFKRVNDTWGHEHGDAVIISVARLLQQQARQSDVVCRNGGEEFLMILPATDLGQGVQIANRLREAIGYSALPPVGQVSVSIGIAEWLPGGVSIEQTLREADAALYQAKRAGRDCAIAAGAPSH